MILDRGERSTLHIRVSDMASDALLRSMEGKLLEIGEAVVSLENRSVDFHSEFVQLFKMDTPLKIVLTKDDLETQSFAGKVYLSAQTMLRLVEVDDEVLPGAKMAYLCDVNLPGVLTAALTEEVAEGFMNLTRRSVVRQQTFPVQVHSLSMQTVYFTSDRRMEKGQYVHLDLPDIGAPGLTLEVERAFNFGQCLSNYHCKIRQMPAETRISLDGVVAELCRQQYKLF